MVKMGKAKKLSRQKQHELSENRGTFINLAEIGGKFIIFVEIGGTFNMHHWLKGMDAPASGRSTQMKEPYTVGWMTRSYKAERIDY